MFCLMVCSAASPPPVAPGLRSRNEQVVLRKSLSELATALNALRSSYGAPEALEQKGEGVRRRPRAPQRELARSPGHAWLDLMRDDFGESVRLPRRAIAGFDAMNVPARRSFVEAGATLTAAAQSHLQEPARRALLRRPCARQHRRNSPSTR